MNSYKFDYYQYKQRINPKSKLSISLCLVVIILLIGATCFLRQNSNKIEFHFVEVGTFFNYKITFARKPGYEKEYEKFFDFVIFEHDEAFYGFVVIDEEIFAGIFIFFRFFCDRKF